MQAGAERFWERQRNAMGMDELIQIPDETEESRVAARAYRKLYETKDSGERAEYASGMVRDTEEGKPRFDLLFTDKMPYDQQMITRWATRMAQGAVKYGDANWTQGEGEEELRRAVSSATRHLMQWAMGETDEDHAAAVMANLMFAEYFKWRIESNA